MTTEQITPLPCPYCNDRARIGIAYGNHFVGCMHNQKCPGRDAMVINRYRITAIKNWNKSVTQVKETK